jgi:23S rRNA (uracil1939-C5)-methyltransferase
MSKVNRDDVVDLDVTDIGFEGKGIARIDGELVVFVEGAVPGDKIRAKIKKVKKKFAEAVIEQVLENSEFRTKPECEHFGVCNGCKMQNIDYNYQLNIKRQSVINAFERIGGFKGISAPPVIGSPNIYFYRNKLEFSFSNDRWLTTEDMGNENVSKKFALGFHMPGFIDKVVDINKCHLQSDLSNVILNKTRDFFKSKGESIFSTRTHEGYLRYLVIRQSERTKDVMVNLITSSEKNKLMEEYSAMILKETIKTDSKYSAPSILNSISSSKAQVAQADYFNAFSGKGFIEETLGKYRFKITPTSFFQTNTDQCEKLFDTIIELVKFEPSENVLDLYCGCGAISIYISGLVHKIFGIELSQDSIMMAHENAELNNVSNCDFAAYDVKDYLAVITKDLTNKYDTIILDPPRSGIHPKAAEYLLEYEAKKIIYVSCNPTTQARDIKLLESKYDITSMQPVDMFPHTFHIENVVRLDLKN